MQFAHVQVRHKAGQAAGQRALAAARRATNQQRLTRLNVQRHRIDAAIVLGVAVGDLLGV